MKISELTKIVKQQKTQITDLQICVSSLEDKIASFDKKMNTKEAFYEHHLFLKEEYGEEAKKQFFCIYNNTLDSVNRSRILCSIW